MDVRNSVQRNRILELLQQERIHVSAHWVFDQLRGEFPRLSLGNVYRNLHILVDQKLVHRLPLGGTRDVYEAARDDHHHFICDRCGAIIDLPGSDELSRSARELVGQSGGSVSQLSLEIRGICSSCLTGEHRSEPVR